MYVYAGMPNGTLVLLFHVRYLKNPDTGCIRTSCNHRFLDEAHFYLNVQVNKKNCPFWVSEKTNIYIKKPLHGDKLTVWAAISAKGIICPFFVGDEFWVC